MYRQWQLCQDCPWPIVIIRYDHAKIYSDFRDVEPRKEIAT
jgi:hypothetical protein